MPTILTQFYDIAAFLGTLGSSGSSARGATPAQLKYDPSLVQNATSAVGIQSDSADNFTDRSALTTPLVTSHGTVAAGALVEPRHAYDVSYTDESGQPATGTLLLVGTQEAGDLGVLSTFALTPGIAYDITSSNAQPAVAFAALALDGAVNGTEGNDNIGGGYIDAQGDRIDGNDNTGAYGGVIGSNDDYVLAGGGNDYVHGGLGNDTIYGGNGNDTLNGAGGKNILHGENGDDRLEIGGGALAGSAAYGGTGNDTLIADNAAALLDGGLGDDLIYGNNGNDTVLGGGGHDQIYAGEGADTVSGGDGNDKINGGIGNDTLKGDAGNDSIEGADGHDSIEGGTGFDTLDGGGGADTIIGGLDGDSVRGGNDNDIIYGDDTAGTDPNGGNDTLFGDAGNDTIIAGYGNDSVNGGYNNDFLDGGRGSDTLDGDSGADTIIGGLEGDLIFGGHDNDILYGDDTAGGNPNGGNDTIDGGAGNDTIIAGYGDDSVNGGVGHDSIVAGFGNDTVDGNTGNDTILGGMGNDSVRGGEGDDIIYGDNLPGTSDAGGNDTLFGDLGNDQIYGNSGNDQLSGGEGNDYLDGGRDADTMTGGAGNDTFKAGHQDLITDFEVTRNADGNNDNNDLVDLSEYYNQTNLDKLNIAREAAGLQPYHTPLGWLRADQADGTLNDINTANGFTIPAFSMKIQNGGTAVDGKGLTYENTRVVCFSAEALIETSRGPVAAGDLAVGDMVRTRDAGFQPICWIMQRTFTAEDLEQAPQLRPIRIKAGALNSTSPSADLVVSPQHRMLIRSKIAMRMFGAQEVLVAAKQLMLLDGIDVADDLTEVTYVHFLLDGHQIVYANGAETESMHTGAEALKTVGKAAVEEIYTIFPELRAGVELPAVRELASGRKGRKLAMRHRESGHKLVG